MTRLMLILATVLATTVATPDFAAGSDENDVEGGTIGTGIMGEITGLGSINVNGLRIELPDDLVVTSSVGDRRADDLAVGETVVVEAVRTDGGFTAHHARLYHPIVAPIEAISGGRLQVMGLDLDISDLPLARVATGDWVAISGLWRGDGLVVSHVEQVAPRAEVVVNATFMQTEAGTQMIGPFAFERPVITDAEAGDHLRVVGGWSAEGGVISPQVIEKGLFSEQVETLLVEGFMSWPDRNGRYFIFGSGLLFSTDDPGMGVPLERSVFCVTPGATPSFTQVIPLDMSRSDRLRLLEALPVAAAWGPQGLAACDRR